MVRIYFDVVCPKSVQSVKYNENEAVTKPLKSFESFERNFPRTRLLRRARLYFLQNSLEGNRMEQTNSEMAQFLDELYNSIPLDQLLSELIEIMSVKEVMQVVKSKIGTEELVKYIQ